MSDFKRSRGIIEHGDPIGPSIEELEQREKLRQLKEGRRNFDPKLGGSPVFRQAQRNKRAIWHRYPRAWMIGLPIFCLAVFYGPMVYSVSEKSNTPLTEQEKRESKIVNAAIESKYGDKWYSFTIPRRREE